MTFTTRLMAVLVAAIICAPAALATVSQAAQILA
jgi:hypothetical protein